MRALAVALVVVYHLHAAALPGGFVGVDVFFVISGFLISSHLIARPPRTPRDLAGFWARRIRRLLPASLFVLAVTLIAVRLLSPETVWQATATDARAAALYVVNWALAGQSVDYLAAATAPTAVQHFWSLSVEEQFYLGWPLVVAAVVVATRRRPSSTRVALGVTFALILAASLMWSIWLTAKNPAAAYFVTPARIWELASGGLLAVLVAGRDPHGAGRRRGPARDTSRVIRVVGAWVGIGMITTAAFFYSSATPFPGYQAALPVVGTLLIIGCGSPRHSVFSPGPILALRPVQWLGDASYSVYLWHWPLIVVTGSWTGHALGARTGVVVLVSTLLLAGLTERYVERPFRAPRAGRSLQRTYGFALVAMMVVIGMSAVQLVEVDRRADLAETKLAAAIEDGGPCFGAASLTRDGRECADVSFDALVPAVGIAEDDRSQAYGDVGGKSCWSGEPNFPDVDCVFGDPSADVTIALFGNSHAGQWLPALQRLADEHHWRIETKLASRCASTDIEQEFQQEGSAGACVDWVRRAADALTERKPDLVIVSNRLQALAVNKDLDDSVGLYAEGYRRILGKLVEEGIPVLAVRDTPAPGFAVPECIASHPEDYATACEGERADWIPVDPVEDVVEEAAEPLLRMVDLNDWFCGTKHCRAVNGGVITYFDGNHMTATFAHTLAPYLEPAVLAALAAGA